MLDELRDWTAPEEWLRITTIDAHAAGEPLRVIIGGYPELPGNTILARRRYARDNLDHLRTALMWEPRGHADMYGCIVTPAVSPETDIGVLFMHNAGYSTMCGHGIIGMTTVVLEAGLLPMTAPETVVRIDTPAGLVTAHARVAGRRVVSVRFRNVPSFVLALDEEIPVPGLERVRYDVAFGGAFYAYVEAEAVGLRCTADDFHPLVEKGMAIKRAIEASRPPRHPIEGDLSFLYGTIFVGPAHSPGAGSRNVCVFAEGQVDRCPTGTGVCGRLAIHHARGEIGLNETMVVESIIGSRFSGRVVGAAMAGPYAAVIPEVTGAAHITGRHEFLIDPRDPLGEGFILR